MYCRRKLYATYVMHHMHALIILPPPPFLCESNWIPSKSPISPQLSWEGNTVNDSINHTQILIKFPVQMIIYCHIRDLEVLFRFHSKETVGFTQVPNMSITRRENLVMINSIALAARWKKREWKKISHTAEGVRPRSRSDLEKSERENVFLFEVVTSPSIHEESINRRTLPGEMLRKRDCVNVHVQWLPCQVLRKGH